MKSAAITFAALAGAALALLSFTSAAQAGPSAPPREDCRKYVPSARVTIAVACADKSGNGPKAAVPVEKPSDKAVGSKLKQDVTYADEPEIVSRQRNAKLCGDILDRVQLGRVLADDISTLRTSCGS